MATVKGYLQLKKKSALKDSWHTYLCEYNAKKRILTVKSKDGNFVFWEKEVDKAWPLEARANRRQNRFDVLSMDGVTAAFAAPKEADMNHWLEVFASKPAPLPTSPKSRLQAAAKLATASPEEIGDLAAEAKELEAQELGDWVAGPFSEPQEEQFEIAGDEADDATINSYASPKVTSQKKVVSPKQRAQTSPTLEEEEPGFLGHVVRWLSQDDGPQGPGVLLEAPTRVSQVEVEAEVELEKKDLEEEVEAEPEEEKDQEDQAPMFEPISEKRVYKDITELLVTHHLGQFVLNFHTHGVDSIHELKGCTDAFLADQVGMKKAHILKFRRALKDADVVPEVATYSVYEAADGFRGTYEDVLAHEQKLGLLDNGKKYKLYEAPDGFRGTYEEVLAHETMLANLNKPKQQTFKLYEAPDGFRGSYEDVVAHERRLGMSMDDPVILRIYEAPDGFRGTYEEVLAHEEKLQTGVSDEDANDVVLFRLYEAPDGFRGTYDEVLAHEERLGLGAGGEHAVSNDPDVLFKLYEAPDGFRGSYDEVLAHEKEMGMDVEDGGAVLFSLYEAPDGFRGTYDEVVAYEEKLGLFDESDPRFKGHQNQAGVHNEPVLFRVYEAPDGFRGSYEDVVAHEKKHGLGGGQEGESPEDDANDPIIYRIYEASDGFRGFYEEVVEHERKHGLVDNSGGMYEEPKKYKLYEAPDGFRGSYEQVLAHERELARGDRPVDKATHIYESPDGFTGLYPDVLKHEKEMGYIEQSSEEIFVENPKLLLKAVENFQSQVTTLKDRVAELEAEVEKHRALKQSQEDNFSNFTNNL